MTYSTAEKACIKMAESRNRLRIAVELLKQDLKTDICQSEQFLGRCGRQIQHACEAKIAEKPFHAVAGAFAAGFLIGKWMKRSRMCTRICS